MANDNNSQTYSVEADRSFIENDRARAIHSDSLRQKLGVFSQIERNELVCHPPKRWSPPTFLRKTATAEEYECLQELNCVVDEYDKSFVGESVLESEAYLWLSNEVKPVVSELQIWCRDYFLHRIRESRRKDSCSDETRLAKFVAESEQIFSERSGAENSLAYVFLGDTIMYAAWFIHSIVMYGEEGCTAFGIPLKVRLPTSAKMSLLEQAIAMDYGSRDNLFVISKLFCCAVPGDVVREVVEDKGVWNALKAMALEMLQLRTLLIGSYDPIKNIALVTCGIAPVFIAVCFGVSRCVFEVVTGDTIASVEDQLRGAYRIMPVGIDCSGVLHDGTMPWVTTLNDERIPERVRINVNLAFVEMSRDLLVEAYRKCEQKLRVESSVDQNGEPSDVSFAIAIHDSTVVDETSVDCLEDKLSRSKMRTIRQNRFFGILVDQFECEVRKGKGSEVVLYSQRTQKHYRLGKHTQNPVVIPEIASKVLRRLGILKQEFLRYIY